jgi:hypothetical protein
MIGPARFVMRQKAPLKSQQHKKANPRISPPHPHNSLPQREGIIPILIYAYNKALPVPLVGIVAGNPHVLNVRSGFLLLGIFILFLD